MIVRPILIWRYAVHLANLIQQQVAVGAQLDHLIGAQLLSDATRDMKDYNTSDRKDRYDAHPGRLFHQRDCIDINDCKKRCECESHIDDPYERPDVLPWSKPRVDSGPTSAVVINK